MVGKIATCLAWAANNFEHVETIGFDYGQRHSVELEVRLEFLSRFKTLSPSAAIKWVMTFVMHKTLVQLVAPP